MIWAAFGTGIIVGVFSGMLLLGLIKELAISRRKSHSGGSLPAEPSEHAAPESRISGQSSGRTVTYSGE